MRGVLLALSLVFAAVLPALAQQPATDPQNTVYLDTKDGRVTIRLRPDLAPKHVEQIKALTKRGFYDGIVFHRVIPGFMAQTGDPTGTGTGKSDLPNLPAEFSREPFRRGSVGMARSQDPNSALRPSSCRSPRFCKAVPGAPGAAWRSSCGRTAARRSA